jgi:hypothetical protein
VSETLTLEAGIKAQPEVSPAVAKTELVLAFLNSDNKLSARVKFIHTSLKSSSTVFCAATNQTEKE